MGQRRAIWLLAAATALAACSSQGPSAPASATTPAATSASAGVPSPSDRLPASIAGSGKLRVGLDATAGEPFAVLGADGSTIEGLDADLSVALAKALGVEVQFVNTAFDGLIPGLQAGHYDVSVSNMLDTKKREATVDFVDFMKDGSAFLVANAYSGAPFTLQGLCGHKVGVIRGTFEEIVVTDQNAKCAVPIQISIFDGNSTGYLALSDGRVEVLTAPLATSNYYSANSGGQFKPGGTPFGIGMIGMAVAKDSELTPSLQAAMRQLMSDGTYAGILAKHGVTDSAIPDATINNPTP